MRLPTISAALLLTASTVFPSPISPLFNSISPRHDIGPGGAAIFTRHMSGSLKTDCGWHEHCIPQCTRSVNCKVECVRGSDFCESACYGDPNTPTCDERDDMNKEKKKARKKAEKNRKVIEKSRKKIKKQKKEKMKTMQKDCKKNWWNWWCK